MGDLAREIQDSLESPIPQVGALLDLDSSLAARDRTLGHRDWVLRGSCVLAAPDEVLTIRHLLGGFGEAAAFFPGFGIYPLDRLASPPRAAETPGDNLAFVRLEGAVAGLPPLRPLTIESRRKYDGTCRVCGYGRWVGIAGGALDGLQRRATVDLGPPKGNGRNGDWRHYDNQDISWSSAANGGLKAGRGNSGGPMLWDRDGWKVVGINRESFGDQQAGAWIDHDGEAGFGDTAGPIPSASGLSCRLIELHERLALQVLDVPAAARRAHVTLNATAGMRLQMRIEAGSAPDVAFAGLASDDRASGRFLYRSLDLDGARQITVAVVPVENAKMDVSRVLAQLCVRFE